MGTHPNAILLCELTPDGIPMKTIREIRAEWPDKYKDKDGVEHVRESSDDINIEGENYHIVLAEGKYLESWQLTAIADGNILVFDLVTYGYGESIKWEELAKRKSDLEKWAVVVCEKYKCRAEFFVTANYW